MKGTITKIVADRGFAFIRDHQGILRFVHASETNGTFDALFEGLEVEFDPQHGPKGPKAVNMRPTGA